MKNKIKLFDRGVFWEAFNRLKIPGIIGSAIFVSSAFILMLTCMIELIDSKVTRVEIPSEYFYITYIIPIVIVPMMMLVAFSYLKTRKTSDFYHAIPVRRETMYFSTIVAALAWIVGILIVASVIPLSMAAFTIVFKIDMVIYWNIISTVLLTSILVLASFALGVSLTGNGFTNFFVSVMIVFLPRVISTIIYSMVEEFTPFLVLNVGNSLLNNQYNIIFRAFNLSSTTIPFAAAVVYTLILAAIYLALGAIAFVKRKSEMAGQASAFKGVQIASRMILPFITLLGSLYFMILAAVDGYDIEYIIFVIALALVAFTIYFIYELITTRRIKKVLKSLVWFPVLVGGVGVVGMIISVGSKIALSRDVDEDRIDYLLVTDMCDYFEDDEFHKLYDERANEIIANAYERQMEDLDEYYEDFWYYGEYDEIVVGVNQGGTTFYRYVCLEYEEYTELKEICMDEIYDDDYILEIPRYEMNQVYFDCAYLSISDEREIYNVLREELKEVSIADVFDYEEEAFTYVNINAYNYQTGYSDWNIPISAATPKTLDAYLDILRGDSNMFNKVDVYENCLKDYEEGYKLDVNLWDIIIIDDDNNAEQIVEVGTPADGEVAEATVEMFKLLEDSEKGDNIIIFEFWAEIYEGNTYDSYDYHYVNSISAYKKYYVTDEVLEEFNDYIELVYEFEKDRLEDEYYDYEDYEDVTVKETETKSIEQIVVPE